MVSSNINYSLPVKVKQRKKIFVIWFEKKMIIGHYNLPFYMFEYHFILSLSLSEIFLLFYIFNYTIPVIWNILRNPKKYFFLLLYWRDYKSLSIAHFLWISMFLISTSLHGWSRVIVRLCPAIVDQRSCASCRG